jgi:4-hydroxyphenylacetate 3-monooxygenase
MAVRTGTQYLEGLRNGREVWLEGARVEDVTQHPRLRRTAQTIAGLYDLQHEPELQDQLTFASPASGEPVALSYLTPETHDDLKRRRRALEIVAASTCGMLGRSPDYVNIQVTACAQCAATYGRREKRWADNLLAYHEYIREHDLALTHTFGHPQVNRALPVGQLPDPYVALGVVDTTTTGVIVRGAKLLATLAPFADELFVPPYRPVQPEEAKYALAFALPMDTPGLKFVCRESFDQGRSLWDKPLSGLYEEMDALAIFDDVLIPWERVFSYDDVETFNLIIRQAPMWPQYMQQVMIKDIAKLEFILGLTRRIVDAIGIGGFAHVQEKVAEIIDILEMVRALLRASEADAGPGFGAGIWPAQEPLIAMRHWFPDAYVRVIWIVEQLAASGLMLTPTEADLQSGIAPTIDRYYQGATIGAEERIRLFRIAWDLCGTDFGSRQALYERFFNGDVVRLRQTRFQAYDYTRASLALERLLATADQVAAAEARSARVATEP